MSRKGERGHFRDSTSFFKDADPKVRSCTRTVSPANVTPPRLMLADSLTQRMSTSLVRAGARCSSARACGRKIDVTIIDHNRSKCRPTGARWSALKENKVRGAHNCKPSNRAHSPRQHAHQLHTTLDIIYEITRREEQQNEKTNSWRTGAICGAHCVDGRGQRVGKLSMVYHRISQGR